MKPPAIRDVQTFRTYGEAVERLCAPGVLSPEQLERLAETGAAAVGTHRVRGWHLPGERLVIAHEGAGVGLWLHELGHAVLGAGGDAEGEAAACELARRLGAEGPGTDASEVAVNGPADSWRFVREAGRVRVLHERCGAEVETWFPAMPGREAHLFALCERCSVSALVPVGGGTCCGVPADFCWAADASPAEPRIERTCPTCGEHEVLMLARRESPEPPAPETIYRERCRDALTQTSRRLRRVAAGELDPHVLGDAVLGHALHAAQRLGDDDREAVESACRDARVLIDRDAVLRDAVLPRELDGGIEGVALDFSELREAAAILEGAARRLA